MILATVAMLFQISAVSPAAKPPQPQQAQVIMAENQPSSIPNLHAGDETDTAKPSKSSIAVGRDSLRPVPTENADAKILAENDPVKTLGIDNEAQMLAAVETPAANSDSLAPIADAPKSVHRPSKVWHFVSTPQRKLQGLIQGR
jgi:hypothetical protein